MRAEVRDGVVNDLEISTVPEKVFCIDGRECPKFISQPDRNTDPKWIIWSGAFAARAVIITRQIRVGRSPFKANVIRRQLLFVARLEYLSRRGLHSRTRFVICPSRVLFLSSESTRYQPRTLFLLQLLDGSLRLQIRVRISNPHNSVTSLPAVVFHPNQVAGSHSPR